MDQPQPISRSLWVDRFAMELGRLEPNVDPERAVEVAGECFELASHLEPEAAVTTFIAIYP